MKGYDAFASVIKSGGKNRRAAKMILNAEHPDLLEFINCKVDEERKAWALIDAGYDGSFNGAAHESIFLQNSNNSLRVPDAFMRALVDDGEWQTRGVTDGRVMETYKAREIMREPQLVRRVDPVGVDCDTTGVEPYIALVTCKHLVGGGGSENHRGGGGGQRAQAARGIRRKQADEPPQRSGTETTTRCGRARPQSRRRRRVEDVDAGRTVEKAEAAHAQAVGLVLQIDCGNRRVHGRETPSPRDAPYRSRRLPGMDDPVGDQRVERIGVAGGIDPDVAAERYGRGEAALAQPLTVRSTSSYDRRWVLKNGRRR